MKEPRDYATTALRLPRDVHQAIHAAAKAEDRTFNGQVVAMVREALATRKDTKHAEVQR